MPELTTFGHIALTESVNKIVSPNTFVKDLLFTNVKEHAAKVIQVDIKVGKKTLAPFVASGDPAVVVGKTGTQSSLVQPPNIRMKKNLSASDLFARADGLPIHVVGGKGGVNESRMKKIGYEQKDLKNILARTEEFMACKALHGGFSITQDNVSFSIDFQMPADNKPILTGTAMWSDTENSDPIANIREWKKRIRTKTGKVPSVGIMTNDVAELFFANKAVQSYMDKRNLKRGEIRTDESILKAGAEKVGVVENVELFVYDETYVDELGNEQSMIDKDGFILAAKNADYRAHYGMIEDLKAGVNFVGKYFSKDWVTEDPSVYWLLVESHPLMAVHEPEAVVFAKVK